MAGLELYWSGHLQVQVANIEDEQLEADKELRGVQP